MRTDSCVLAAVVVAIGGVAPRASAQEVAVAAGGTAPSATHAPARSAVLLPVHGDAARVDALQRVVTGELTAALIVVGARVLRDDEVSARVSAELAACDRADCAAALARAANVDVSVRAAVWARAEDQTAHSVGVTVFDADGGEYSAAVEIAEGNLAQAARRALTDALAFRQTGVEPVARPAAEQAPEAIRAAPVADGASGLRPTAGWVLIGAAAACAAGAVATAFAGGCDVDGGRGCTTGTEPSVAALVGFSAGGVLSLAGGLWVLLFED